MIWTNIAKDDFHRADGDPGSDWTGTGSDPWMISGNTLVSGAAAVLGGNFLLRKEYADRADISFIGGANYPMAVLVADSGDWYLTYTDGTSIYLYRNGQNVAEEPVSGIGGPLIISIERTPGTNVGVQVQGVIYRQSKPGVPVFVATVDNDTTPFIQGKVHPGTSHYGPMTYTAFRSYGISSVIPADPPPVPVPLPVPVPVPVPVVPAASPDVAAIYIGDSLTWNPTGYNGESVTVKSAQILAKMGGIRKVQIANEGRSGSTTEDWKDTAGSYWYVAMRDGAAIGANVAVIALGRNDATNGVTPAQYGANLAVICANALAAGYERVLLDYPPFCIDVASNRLLLAYQSQIDAIVNGSTILQGDTLAYEWFQANQGELLDGTHLTPAGVDSWAVMRAVAFYKRILEQVE